MSAIKGTFYEYAPKLYAYELGGLHSDNVLIFVGGLGDGFLPVPYTGMLSTELNKIGWSVIQIGITSSLIGWGTGSLERDSSEIGKLVAYLKSKGTPGGGRKLVGIMGHSTGCQNTVHYFSRVPRYDNYTPLDFGIIQAPVSDRYACEYLMPKELFDRALKLAKKYIDENNKYELMPIEYCNYYLGAPINVYRWYSLFSVKGDDDFFSPDFSEKDLASTFGKFDKPLLTLYSGADEYVPKSLDKEALMKSFKKATGKFWSPLSKIVKGAAHNVGEGSEKGVMEDTVSTVVAFLGNCY